MTGSQSQRDYERAVTPHKDAASFTDEEIGRLRAALEELREKTGDSEHHEIIARALGEVSDGA